MARGMPMLKPSPPMCRLSMWRSTAHSLLHDRLARRCGFCIYAAAVLRVLLPCVFLQVCLGPVCVPLNLLLPFLVGVAHRAGWLSWFKREWVTLRYWRSFFSSTPEIDSTGGNRCALADVCNQPAMAGPKTSAWPVLQADASQAYGRLAAGWPAV